MKFLNTLIFFGHPEFYFGHAHILLDTLNFILDMLIFFSRHFVTVRTPIGFLYSSWETHTPRLNLIRPGILDLSCLQAKINKIPKIANFV